MSATSTLTSPTFTSFNNVSREKQAPTLAEIVKNLNTEKLIEFLRGENLQLTDAHYEILRQKEISGCTFLKTIKDEFRDLGLKFEPATILVEFAKEVKNKKLRAFSSSRTLKDFKKVLAKYGIDSNNITSIPQFQPEPHTLDEKDEVLRHCISDILLKLENMGTVADSNESMRREYISSILHASVRITRKVTGKEIIICLEQEIIGEQSSGRVDYGITDTEDLSCIAEGKQNLPAIGFAQNLVQLESSCQTNLKKQKKRKASDAFGGDDYEYLYGIVSTGTDWYFILYMTEGIYCTSETEYHISLTKSALKDDTDLKRNVKRVMEIIVDGDNSSENVNVPDPAINQCIDTNTKLLEDKEMIDFLDEKNKEKVSNEIRQRNKERKLLHESDKNQFQDLSLENYNISSGISCNTEITNEQDSLSVSHIISTNNLRKLKKKEALIQEISFEKNYTNENLSSDWEKKLRFQDLSSNNNSLETNPKDSTEISKEETKSRGYDSSNLNIPEISSESKSPTNLFSNDISNIKASIPTESSHTSNSEDMISENNKSLPETKPITFEARPDPELIIKSVLEHFLYLKFQNSFRGIDNYNFASPQPWSSPCPICNGKHGSYGLYGEWYRKNRNQLPYDPELAK
ncbi:25911_t:CDS:2 [Gigaspora margarita]|uniref:25911_t:CDS:1 n=1 Tax=Gigaspora margarita TaxID=4874 RepID=A0ABM8VW93_GIGMA|nr:25911_t:CDS:2 [Gigaspora margarita]